MQRINCASGTYDGFLSALDEASPEKVKAAVAYGPRQPLQIEMLGHEGAGVVVEAGPGVTSVQPGDHVIPRP